MAYGGNSCLFRKVSFIPPPSAAAADSFQLQERVQAFGRLSGNFLLYPVSVYLADLDTSLPTRKVLPAIRCRLGTTTLLSMGQKKAFGAILSPSRGALSTSFRIPKAEVCARDLRSSQTLQTHQVRLPAAIGREGQQLTNGGAGRRGIRRPRRD